MTRFCVVGSHPGGIPGWNSSGEKLYQGYAYGGGGVVSGVGFCNISILDKWAM